MDFFIHSILIFNLVIGNGCCLQHSPKGRGKLYTLLAQHPSKGAGHAVHSPCPEPGYTLYSPSPARGRGWGGGHALHSLYPVPGHALQSPCSEQGQGCVCGGHVLHSPCLAPQHKGILCPPHVQHRGVLCTAHAQHARAYRSMLCSLMSIYTHVFILVSYQGQMGVNFCLDEVHPPSRVYNGLSSR